jgi:hypothetical protein
MSVQERAHTLVVGRYLEALMRNALQLGFVVSRAAAVLAVPVPVLLHLQLNLEGRLVFRAATR